MSTPIVQSTNVTSPIALAASQAWDLLPDVSVAVTIGNAINTSGGDVLLDVAGSIFGAADNGFSDSSGVGGDVIAVDPQGVITATNDAISSLGDRNYITNEGTIQSTEGYAILLGAGNTISNSGSIIGFYYAIEDGGGDSITNTGEISARFNQDDTISEAAGDNTIFNSGTISSAATPCEVYIAGADNTIVNSGAIEGGEIGLQLTDGHDTITNHGLISGAGAAIEVGGTLGGVDIANSGVIDGAVSIDGPASSLVNSGTIDGAVTLNGLGSRLFNSNLIDGAVAFGLGSASFVNKGQVIGNVVFSGTHDSYEGGSGSVDGEIVASGSQGTYIGGADDDTFVFAASTLSSGDVVQGRGGDNTLKFSSAGTISAGALGNVSGIETIDLANGTNSLTLTNALVGSAGDATLAIDGGGGRDTIAANLVTKASDNVVIDGGGGADTFLAGAAHDTFLYKAASDSTGAEFDTISGANFARDFFQLPGGQGSIKAIKAAVTTGTLSTGAAFNADLAAAIGASQLGADDAVLLTASAGNLKHQSFLVVDLNGIAGYQANADLVIHLTGATGTLTTTNFV